MRDRTSAPMLAPLLAAGLLFSVLSFSALSAQVRKRALVDLTYKRIFANFGTTYRTGMGVATVATPTPTPSVMWPANVVSGTFATTFSGGYTPFASRAETFGA